MDPAGEVSCPEDGDDYVIINSDDACAPEQKGEAGAGAGSPQAESCPVPTSAAEAWVIFAVIWIMRLVQLCSKILTWLGTIVARQCITTFDLHIKPKLKGIQPKQS